MGSDRSRKRKAARTAAAMLAAMMLSSTAPASAESYIATESGHPLRVLAYVVHPIGVILDWVIFRPFYWLGSQEYVKTLVGREDE